MTINQMRHRLEQFFPESNIEVIDLTGTSDHWEVHVESLKFQGLSKIQQHQKVMSCFDAELKTGEVHALSIKTTLKKG